jgi:hypothetical protein
MMHYNYMVREIDHIRANTDLNIPLGFGIDPSIFAQWPPRSPFQPPPTPPGPAVVQHLILRKFVEELPDSPSPFKVDIFVESPAQARKLIERPVTFKGEGTNARWVEKCLVLAEPEKYRAHCVMAATIKVDVDMEGTAQAEGDCSVWTRKYPSGWEGVMKNEKGELVSALLDCSITP